MAYNTDIYSSFREALQAPYGIAIVSVFAEVCNVLIGTGSNPHLKPPMTSSVVFGGVGISGTTDDSAGVHVMSGCFILNNQILR